MKIVGFCASPHENGNTAWTLNKILEGAKEHGAETVSFYSSCMDIKPCSGCLGCKQDNLKCIVNDDMQKIYKEIEDSDTIILGTPIYMGQMAGQAKIFIDRLFAEISPRFSPHFKERDVKQKLILVFTQGNPNADFFKKYYDYTKEMFQLLEFDVQDVVVVAGTRTELAKDKDGLQEMMKNIGAGLI